MAIEQIEKMLNREKYSSIFEEVIFMEEDKYEFAKKLFNVKVSEREKWLRNLFKNNSNKEKLEDLLREAFVKW